MNVYIPQNKILKLEIILENNQTKQNYAKIFSSDL